MDDVDDDRVLGRPRTATVLGRDRTATVLGRDREVATPAPERTEAPVADTRTVDRTMPRPLSDVRMDGGDDAPVQETMEQRRAARDDLKRVNDPDVTRFLRENPDADIHDFNRWVENGRLKGRPLQRGEARTMRRSMGR